MRKKKKDGALLLGTDVNISSPSLAFCTAVKVFVIKIIQFTFVQFAKRMLERNTGGFACCGGGLLLYVYMIHCVNATNT